MRILVTGAAGFIGSWVVRALLERDHDVIGTFRPRRTPPTDVMNHGKFTAWPADLDDLAAIETLARGSHAEVTIHMAWYADPATYLHSPRNMDSLAMTVRFARALYENGCRKFVGAGTCVEYAPSDQPRKESDAIGPRTLYGVCKHAARSTIAALAAEQKKEFAWARLFHLHGPGDARVRLVPSLVDQLRRGAPVDLTDGTQIRDHLHVSDVGTALATIAASDAAGAVNVCSGEPVTLRHIAETVAQIVGHPELLRFGARPQRPGEVMFLAGDASRLRGFAWTPRWTLEDGLRDAVSTA
jgi:dTDP-6-deoxy-L-talose 4-dehydrogenase (NAD+)